MPIQPTPSILQKLISHYGSMNQLALALGTTSSRVVQWVKRGYIPERNALAVSDLGLGITAEDVLREAREMRPVVRRGHSSPLSATAQSQASG